MKVLHVWSVAGVAEILAKYMQKVPGVEADVMVRKKFDRFGFNDHPLNDGTYRYALRAISQGRRSDVVQVHNWDPIVPWLRRLTGAKVVISYHNFNIANEWAARRPRWSKAHARVIATPGLAEMVEGATFIAEPVDTEKFYDEGHHEPGTALTSAYSADAEAESLAGEHGLKLTFLRRDTAPVPHSEFPSLLNKFEYYIDIKRSQGVSNEIVKATGMTCLEALACGCKVIRWDGKVLQGLPEENRPDVAAGNYLSLYQSLLSA
ncbi:MAG TPA: hypothetical protein VFE91_05150 [Nitrososphaerales archaeon]|nr:hypothetical protein [Nitrososphaerales archaeon]